MSRLVAARGTALAVATVVVALAASCRRDGCVGGDDGTCVPPSACPAVRFTCTGATGSVRVTKLDDGFSRLPGPKSMAAKGDILLENDLVSVVIDAPDHPQNLAPSGGSILDFAPIGMGTGDQVNGIYQAAGLLPRDAVHYETLVPQQNIGQGVSDTYAAVIARGHLEGDSRITVVTRYELRPCEPGLRVRTDLYNGSPDPNTLYLTDGFFWGDQTLAPFVPGQGLGFRAPEVELLHIDRAWREWPLMAARSQGLPDVSYAAVPCDRPSAAGFNSTTLSAAGVPLAPTQPGDGFHFERFILAVPGPGLAPAVAAALRVRTMAHGDPLPVTVTGRVVASGVPIDGHSGRAASLLFYEPAPGTDPDDESRRTPWSEAVPGTDGRFTVTLPPNRAYRVQPFAFGRPTGPATSFAVASADSDLGDVTVTAPVHLVVSVLKTPDQPGPMDRTFAELVVVPIGATTPTPSFYGLFPGCDPMLGPPYGSSPACNRALTSNGVFDLLLPPGHFYVYATRGPFATLDRRELLVDAGNEVSLTMVVEDLPGILPAGAVTGDFHVHGAASYDASIRDEDRVISFLAAGVDVVVATDHDVVTTYKNALAAFNSAKTLVVIPGVEQTPNILWFDVPGQDFPKTLGHFNFWPLVQDSMAPRNGDPWDELREPGQLMDDMTSVFAGSPDDGVRQLNHPFLGDKLGRDQGFLTAIGYNPTTPIALGASFAADVLLRAPGNHRLNLDWDVEEVMTGSSRAEWLRYRALWFSLLSQGILRAGTANSDTHGLAGEQIGYPRNVILSDADHVLHGTDHRTLLGQGQLDVPAFDADVRQGHMIGTNGPVLDVSITDASRRSWGPSVDVKHPIPFTPAATLNVKVTAAPWIPVAEVRVYVNGELKVRQDISSAFNRSNVDPFGDQPAGTAVPISFSLPSLMPATGDAWLVVEAGLVQNKIDTIDDGGLPVLPDSDVPGVPSMMDPRFDIQAIAPGVWPTAFSNPFLIDRDGDGAWQAPGL
jgi:hypothetical protein